MGLFQTACLISAVTLLVACNGPKVSSNDYFPTAEGLTWVYAKKKETEFENTTSTVTISTVGKKPVWFADGSKQFLPVRQTNHGTDYYIQETADAYYRAARRLVIELKPVPDPQARLILPRGENLRPGFIWSAMATPYAVSWKPPFTEMNASIKPFDMLYEVLSVDETVSTPAGEFTDCVLIQGTGSMTIYADPKSGYNEILITHKEWYAPGVGLVRLERTEPLELNIISGGQITMVLTDFSSAN